MPNKPMYALTAEYAELLDAIYDASDDGEISPAAMEAMKLLEQPIKSKAEGICHVLGEIDASAAGLKAEIDRLTKRRKSLDKNYDDLKEYLKTCLESVGMDRVEAGVYRLAIRQNPPAVEIVDLKEIPLEYDREQKREIDKTLVKEAIQAGKEVPGARLVRGNRLEIK